MPFIYLLVIAASGVCFAENNWMDRGPDALHGHWSASRLVGSLGGLPLVFGNKRSANQQLKSKSKEKQCCLPDTFELSKYETAAQIVGQHTTFVRVEQHASLDKGRQLAAINQTEWIESRPGVNLYMIIDIAKASERPKF